ncbi:MAG: DUF4364 family protein [Christensenellales bacterium]
MESKVLCLYALDVLGPCGNLQLIGFMVETDIMNYFDLQTALYQLRDAGQVARTPQTADDLYQITQSGQETLRLFLQRAPRSAMAAIDRVGPDFRRRILEQRERSARIVHDEHNEYHVILQVTEQQLPLISIDLSLPTPELAARFRDRWAERAQEIYDFIIGRLAGEDRA